MNTILCSECFTDQGLRLDAERIGETSESACPSCRKTTGRKLNFRAAVALANRFFVWGTLHRYQYGAAPVVQFNEHQQTSIEMSEWLRGDVELLGATLGVGFFYYGPRLWMLGEVEPLKALQEEKSRSKLVKRIVEEYPELNLESSELLYRIRKAPKNPDCATEYDSPPQELSGSGRLDSPDLPVMYTSQDLEVCVHECRVVAEDEIYVATLAPQQSLRLLDVSQLLREEHVTEFESLDMAMHMLFLAGKHSYEISRDLARAAHAAGFDGMIYSSYFSLLQTGTMPFETAYGLSLRRFPEMREYEQSKLIPNIALFGRPIHDEKVTVRCINKLILSRVSYDFHFGPVGY